MDIILSDDTLESKHLTFDLSEEDEKKIKKIIERAIKEADEKTS